MHQLAEVIRLRNERAQIVGSSYKMFSTMRRTLDELYGAGSAFVLAGIEGPTARKPNKLLRQLDLALPRLLDPGLELPPPRVISIRVDPQAMASELRTQAERLRAVQAEFRRARRILQETRKEKNRAIKRHEQSTLWTGRTLEGYYQLAGETELAERLRPVTRRLGRPPVVGPPEGGPSEDSESEEPESEESEIEESEIEESVSEESVSEESEIPESLTGFPEGFGPASPPADA